MGTLNNPGKFDCKPLSDEPTFLLLARDPDFKRLVNKWARKRERDIKCGERPSEDYEKVLEARKCADDGANWRARNMGKWRK